MRNTNSVVTVGVRRKGNLVPIYGMAVLKFCIDKQVNINSFSTPAKRSYKAITFNYLHLWKIFMPYEEFGFMFAFK